MQSSQAGLGSLHTSSAGHSWLLLTIGAHLPTLVLRIDDQGETEHSPLGDPQPAEDRNPLADINNQIQATPNQQVLA